MKIKHIGFFLKDAILDAERVMDDLVGYCEMEHTKQGTIYHLQIVVDGEIVRCKNCKYFSQNDRWCKRYECDEGCSFICWDLGEDGFCSKAEERIYCKDCKYFKLGKCYWRGDFEEAEKMNGVEIIREYPQPTNMNDWCGNGEKK